MGGRDFTGKRVGRYLLASPLGSGTGGSVYRGVDLTSKDSPPYAIKCVRKSSHPGRRRQQLAEVKNHDTVVCSPRVLMLCDTFERHRYSFLVFPLCEMDMSTAIFEKQLYWRNDDRIRQSFVEIVDGILACHMKGIFHRDLKPENIMCNADGTRIKIADFGLSTDRRVCTDGGCGTLPYMSPECLDAAWNRTSYDACQADIWSLGVILFNMVTRRYPWEEPRIEDTSYIRFLLDRDYLFRTSSISESLSLLLRRIWHPVPTKRMSALEIRRAVIEMHTFYKVPHAAPASSKVPAALVDSEKTCVALVGDKEKKGPIDTVEHAFRGMKLRQGIPLARTAIEAHSR